MPTRLLLFASSVVMTALGGLLIGPGLGTTPLGPILFDNSILLFVVGALIGIVMWTATTFFGIALCSEIVFVAMGNERMDSLSYLLSALLFENAGEMKLVQKGEIKVIKERGAMAKFSHPGYVIIYHGHAVVMERFGKPSQVAPKGLVKTKPFESIRAVVDLSLQNKQRQVTLHTKDGVPLQTDVRVYFQIHAGGHKPTSGDMYPFLEKAVLNAVYGVPDWREYTLETVVANLRQMIACRYLNDIYDPMKRLATHTHRPSTELQLIKDELQGCLDMISFNWGVKILNLEIDVKPPKEIEDEALAFEKRRMDQQIAIEEGQTENRRIQEFMEQTGGSVADYALIHFCQNIGESGNMPLSLDQFLSDSFQRASLRQTRREEKQLNLPAHPENGKE